MSIEGEVREILTKFAIDSREQDFLTDTLINSTLSAILKMTNLKPLSEKEVEKALKNYSKNRGDWGTYNQLAIFLCSHFSKQIKYPEKKKETFTYICGEHIGKCDMTPSTDCYDCQCAKISEQREITKEDKIYNQAISDMKRLNGEGV